MIKLHYVPLILFLLSPSISSAKVEILGLGCDYGKIKSGQPHIDDHLLLQQAVGANCPDLMDQVLKNEKAEDIFDATRKYTEGTLAAMDSQMQLVKGLKVDDNDPVVVELKSQAAVMNKFSSFLKEKCPDLSKESDACRARNIDEAFTTKLKAHWEQVLAEEQAEEKADEYRESPQGLVDAACTYDKYIALNQAAINRQKEIGKVSGTVDMTILHRAGAQIVDLQRLKKETKAKYKAKTKKELRNYKCKNSDDLVDPGFEAGLRGL